MDVIFAGILAVLHKRMLILRGIGIAKRKGKLGTHSQP
jgi:hypothetical protein